MNRLPKLTLLVFSLILTVGLVSGCQAKISEEPKDTLPEDGISETGNTLEISDKNDQSIAVTPGDIVHLKLEGRGGLQQQWSVISPTTTSFLSLKESNIAEINTVNATSTFELYLKILETGTQLLQFNYVDFNLPAEANVLNKFTATLISN